MYNLISAEVIFLHGCNIPHTIYNVNCMWDIILYVGYYIHVGKFYNERPCKLYYILQSICGTKLQNFKNSVFDIQTKRVADITRCQL